SFGPLQAFTPYTTGMVATFREPRYFESIRVVVSGAYCQIAPHGLQYTSQISGVSRAAVMQRAELFHVQDVVAALKFDFEQVTYSNVHCILELHGIEPPQPLEEVPEEDPWRQTLAADATELALDA